MLILFQLPFYIAPGAVLKTELGTLRKDFCNNVRDTVRGMVMADMFETFLGGGDEGDSVPEEVNPVETGSITLYGYQQLKLQVGNSCLIFDPEFIEDKVIAESDTSKGLQRFIRGYDLISSDSEEARTYYHYASDNLGSITDVMNYQGQVQNHYEYDAFGEFEVKEEQVANRFGFTGGEQL